MTYDLRMELLHARRIQAWTQLVVSTDKFTQAELLFAQRTADFAEQYPNHRDSSELSIEALKARDSDEQWKSAVADCQYHVQRMQAFAALHHAALEEMRLLLPKS